MSDDGTYDLPDTEDVLQEEPEAMPLTAIPVAVQGPVRTQHPGVRLGASVNRLVDDVEQLVGDDPRRARVILYATTATAAFFVGPDRSAVQAGATARINTSQLLILHTGQALYAKSATPGTASQISIITELYTD